MYDTAYMLRLASTDISGIKIREGISILWFAKFSSKTVLPYAVGT